LGEVLSIRQRLDRHHGAAWCPVFDPRELLAAVTAASAFVRAHVAVARVSF